MDSGGGGASDQEIQELMAELSHRERTTARAARRVETPNRKVATLRMNLALHAMSRTTEFGAREHICDGAAYHPRPDPILGRGRGSVLLKDT